MGTSVSKSYTHLCADFYKGSGPEGPYYLVRYMFNSWADADAIVNELMGLSYRVGGTTIRNTPHQHPLSPNLFCQGARVVGVGRPALNALGFPGFDQGFVIEANYGISIPQGLLVDPNRDHQIDTTNPPILWCTQELDFDTEVILIPQGFSQWLSDSKVVNVPVQVQVGITTMTLTFHRVPYLPTASIRSLRGKINSSTFLNASAETVLFRGAKTTREGTSDGSVSQRVTLVFQERDQSWNKTLRKPNVWDTIVNDVGDPRYTSANLGPLIQL